MKGAFVKIGFERYQIKQKYADKNNLSGEYWAFAANDSALSVSMPIDRTKSIPINKVLSLPPVEKLKEMIEDYQTVRDRISRIATKIIQREHKI